MNLISNQTIRSIFHAAWSDFKKNKVSLLLLTAIYFLLIGLQIGINYLANMQGYDFIQNFYIPTIVTCIIIFYGAFFNQNMLDAVFNRKLRWFKISSSIANTIFVTFMMGELFAIYSFFINIIKLPNNVYLAASIIITLIALYACTFYLLLRSMFVDLLLLHDDYTISQAFFCSWDMTQNNLLSLIVFGFVINFVLILGILMLGVGVFVTFPLSMLMKVHLFKKILEAEQE